MKTFLLASPHGKSSWFYDLYDPTGEWIGASGSSYDVGVDYAKSEGDRTGYFRFTKCEYCGTRNSNDDKTFYCVACGGPLPA